MEVKFFPKLNGAYGEEGGGYSVDEIKKGVMWLYADVKCPACGKEQSVANTGYVGGPCMRCGARTDGSPSMLSERSKK
jgi:ribosomal protein L37AE/L43A